MTAAGSSRFSPHRIPRPSLILLFILLLGCTSPPPPDESPAEAPSFPPSTRQPAPLPERSEFVDNALGVAAATRVELRTALGEPDSVAAEQMPNRHVPGVMDTIFTLHYSDLAVRFHHPGGGGDLLSMVQVSDNRHLRYPVIGSEPSTIEAAFGRPDEASDSSIAYFCTTCEAGDDPVELVIVDGKVRRVRFNYYVD